MRKTGGDNPRRVEMCIIDCLCKQLFLIADGAYKKKKQLPTLSGSRFFFFINLQQNTHNKCIYENLHRKD